MDPGDPGDPRGLKITFKPIFYDQKCMEIKIPGSKTIFDASKRRKNRKNEIQKIRTSKNISNPIFLWSKFYAEHDSGLKTNFWCIKKAKTTEKIPIKNRIKNQ